MKKGKCGHAHVAWWLIMLGALNWGLVGAFDFNLVAAVLGSVAWLETLTYVLIGLSALMMLIHKFGMAGCCGKGKGKDKKCCR